jgi:A/G-specific adenine glycosylase
MSCAAAAFIERNAGRTIRGNRVPSGREPWTDRGAGAIPAFVLSSSAIVSAESLLRWYDRHRRRLPWRALPGKLPDPYHVWLSEIMLQQTTVAAVGPYYERFVSRFPTVAALAAAPLDAVLQAWAGLGYYARARNLHACARAVAAAGGFPRDLDGLRALPGIGDYTARAVGAIAFAIPAVPMDGNVERVVARLFAVTEQLPAAKATLRRLADRLGADPDAAARPGDFAQALFDLGATICTPAGPACGLCPWLAECAARRAGNPADLPRRAPKKPRPQRWGVHFWLQDAAGNVLLRRRPESGLLGGMAELPGTAWRDAPWDGAEALRHAPMPATWQPAGQVRHGFTHFALTIDLFVARVAQAVGEGFLHPVAALDAAALPSVMRKCVAMAAPVATAGADSRDADPDPRGAAPDPRGAGPDPRGAGPDPRGADPDPRGADPDLRRAGPDPRGADPDLRRAGPAR